MAPPRYLPSVSILEGWIQNGMTHQQIADRIRQDSGVTVSRSTVSAALSKAGLTNRTRYDQQIPWRVAVEHNRHHLLNMLRLAARQDAGADLDDEQVKLIENFRRRLKESGAVVAYERDSPDGWYLVKARPKDTGLIRIPD